MVNLSIWQQAEHFCAVKDGTVMLRENQTRALLGWGAESIKNKKREKD